MRSLFLILLLANLLLFAVQFTAVRELLPGTQAVSRASQLNPEKLRIIRDTSIRPPSGPTPAGGG